MASSSATGNTVPSEAAVDGPGSYSTDLPIESSRQDRFSRAPFAQRIADTIASRTDTAGLVLGLYGPWGDGKTSVLKMIEEHLKGRQHVVVTRFNPWHFTTDDQLLRGFFGTLASAIGARLTSKKEEIGEALAKYGTLLSVVNGGDAAKGLGEALSATTLDELKARVEGFLAEGHLRVVVLIDDIDRLDRGETHLMFKLVKLSAGFSRTTYLLAFDDAVVSAALGERYGAGGDAAGRAFLEKIIQVPLHLPSAEPTALRQLVFEGVNRALDQAKIELSQSQADAFILHFSILEESLATPRQAHLYANALLFSLPMVKGEVNVADFMLIEALRLFHPRLHQAVRSSASIFLSANDGTPEQREQRKKRFNHMIEEATPELSPERRRRLINDLLLPLFPRTGNVGYGSDFDAEWAREQRVCSIWYFHKFFAYGESTSQISDRRIQKLLDNLLLQSPTEQDESLRALATLEAVASLVRRLRQGIEHMSPSIVEALALLLARNGHLFPNERGAFALGGTFTQAGILVKWLIKSIGDVSLRLDLAQRVLRLAAPLPFTSECLRWLFPSLRLAPEDRPFEQAEFDMLQSLVVTERIIPSDMQEPLYRQFGSESMSLYASWHEVDHVGLANRLTSCLNAAVEEVDAFLDVFVGDSWESGTGLSRRSDLERAEYDNIVHFISPNVIGERLRVRYGAQLDNPQFHHGSGISLPLRIAHQFMYVHSKVLAESSADNEPAAPGVGGQVI
ncbi:AAA family ATPase (plasmid) [Xanthomonas citri pv. citri]|uniref:KAP family P-loop NTPase fold protein n=1 Tax=Xanthomonas citri TaxID=346 RepID=UPI0019328586|nr:P-loop NTPase fold protein [Xanthomonas citri]QRD62767.1 AAA family ATPase [Xanthomonas citri pv. citri]QRD67094.1 AAA family ATPase [Xanthomonas citri pv. citri]QRD71653.1 AAA family ATPase [Xanthomonas citri pv. citri]